MIDKVLSPEIINRYSGYYFKVERSALNKLDKAYFENKYGKSTSIIKEDWDNLVLLDACRYDTFSNRNFLQGDLKKRVSNASTSTEFIKNNFCGENLHDTVYITANPYVSMIDSDVFHGVITLFDKWDMEKQTIMPGSVVDSVAEINDLYPNKKLIVHFMQPHQPYIGEKGEQIRSKIKDEVGLWGWNNPSYDTKGEKISMFDAVRYDHIDVDNQDIREAYAESLDIVLREVDKMTNDLVGKTVISSDHGELLGERVHLFKRYGHPGGFYRKELRNVPWFVLPSENRKEVKAESPKRYDTVDEEVINEKLKHLGYK